MALSADNVANLWIGYMSSQVPESSKKHIPEMKDGIKMIAQCIYEDMKANGKIVGSDSQGGSIDGKIE